MSLSDLNSWVMLEAVPTASHSTKNNSVNQTTNHSTQKSTLFRSPLASFWHQTTHTYIHKKDSYDAR